MPQDKISQIFKLDLDTWNPWVIKLVSRTFRSYGMFVKSWKDPLQSTSGLLPFSADLAHDMVTFRCKKKNLQQIWESKTVTQPISKRDLSADSDTGPVREAIRTQMGHQLKHTDLRKDGSTKLRDGRLIHFH